MGKIYVVGLGPGDEKNMTLAALEALRQADIIVGYTGYVSLLGEEFAHKEIISTGMRRELDRCRLCIEKAAEGKTVALICSGDAGIYGMASPLLEMMAGGAGEIIPGISALSSGAALLGAPINHDFCTVSLSDLLTPWEIIEKRLRGAAIADFVIVIYNPSSKGRPEHLKRACDVLMETIPGDRPCGAVTAVGREGERLWLGTLAELGNQEADMFTTCFVGNAGTYIKDGRMITPRGYENVNYS